MNGFHDFLQISIMEWGIVPATRSLTHMSGGECDFQEEHVIPGV